MDTVFQLGLASNGYVVSCAVDDDDDSVTVAKFGEEDIVLSVLKASLEQLRLSRAVNG